MGGQENYLGEYLEIIPTKRKGNPRFSMYCYTSHNLALIKFCVS